MAEEVPPPNYNPDTECLFDIEDSDLRLLSDLYKENEQNPYATSLLDNGIRIRDLMKGYPLRFMSPLGVWKDSGTFIANIEFDSCIEVGVFTLNPEDEYSYNDAIFSGLNFTKRINFDSNKRPVIFKEIHEKLVPLIKRIVRKRFLQIEKEEKFHVFKMIKDDAIQLEVSISEDANIEIKPLNAIHSFVIKEHWPHPLIGEDDIPCALIDVNGGYGIFLKSTGQLVSWGIKTMMGQIGFVQTLKEFQRKGYASIIVRKFAKEFASEGINPCAIVAIDDIVSHNFFENNGFKKVGYCHNIYLKLRKNALATDNYEAGEGTSKS